MMGQKANATDFPPMTDVIWFSEDDTAHYGHVIGWGIGMVVVSDDECITPVDPSALYYF